MAPTSSFFSLSSFSDFERAVLKSLISFLFSFPSKKKGESSFLLPFHGSSCAEEAAFLLSRSQWFLVFFSAFFPIGSPQKISSAPFLCHPSSERRKASLPPLPFFLASSLSSRRSSRLYYDPSPLFISLIRIEKPLLPPPSSFYGTPPFHLMIRP